MNVVKDRDAAFGVFVEITSYSHSNRIRTVTQDNYYFPGVEDERLHQTTQEILFSFYHGFPTDSRNSYYGRWNYHIFDNLQFLLSQIHFRDTRSNYYNGNLIFYRYFSNILNLYFFLS